MSEGNNTSPPQATQDPSERALVCTFAPDGVITEANLATFELAGVTPESLLGKRFDAVPPLSHSAEIIGRVDDILKGASRGATIREELPIRLAGARIAIMDCLASPLYDRSGRINRIVGTAVEVTRQKEEHAALLRLNRALRMLSDCNQVLARADTDPDLLASLCKVIVDTGDYALAWIGRAEHDEARNVLPLASAGVHAGYVRDVGIGWGDDELGWGPTGRAVRSGQPEVAHDLSTDGAFAPWREQARRSGFASSIALPFDVGEERLALNIYSSRMAAFDPIEVDLLRELTADIAHALRALRNQAQIDRLTRILRMQAAMNAAVLRIRERDELLTETCRLATQVGGYDRAVVSMVDPDGSTASPRFRAGAAGDFPEPATLEIRDGTEPDVCLTGRALRTGELAICSDLTKSEPPVAMRERLVELGYRSVVALPLIVDGHRLGALTLASRNRELVGEEELRLLQDMTSTLSFALRAQRHADEMQQLAFYDPVTGLANRAHFCRRLDESLREGVHPRQHPVVAAFDIQQLGKISDTYGRNFGDALLQEVAARLKRTIENEERIGYLGGGVFVIVEPELIASAERFRSPLDSTVFAEPFSIEGRTLRITFRSGLARFPTDGSAADTLVQRAEVALRHAKDTGEQYEHYALDIHSGIAERIALEHRLQTAIDEQQFELYYQPQVDMQSDRIESVEALLRWNDPARGLVSPAEFLPVLEASGMIEPVGAWVLQEALRDCRRWRDEGLPAVRVAVNVSALQLRRRSFVPFVLDLLRRHQGDAAAFGLDLEITETAVLQDVESATRKLQELRAAGVRIALDDFGTGYSSLGLLPTLPVDILKIDQTFVGGLPARRSSATLVASMIQLASAFRLVSIAEGVETPEQLGMLRQMNCGLTQGFLHGVPVSATQVKRLLGG